MLVKVKRTTKRIIKLKYDNGMLHVTANIFLSKRRIRQAIEENIEWIRSQKERAATIKQASSTYLTDATVAANKYFDSPSLSQQQHASDIIGDVFAGRKTFVLGDIVDVLPSASTKTHMEDNTLYINDKYFNSKELRLKAIASYLKRIAQIYVSTEVSKFGASHSLCPAKIEFKNIPQGWCKCSLAGEKFLCLDYRISQLPENLRVYLIAHSFAHFYSFQHDDKFYNTLEHFVPNYSALRLELENYEYLKDI